VIAWHTSGRGQAHLLARVGWTMAASGVQLVTPALKSRGDPGVGGSRPGRRGHRLGRPAATEDLGLGGVRPIAQGQKTLPAHRIDGARYSTCVQPR
jgi:hypothetical protein